MTSGAGRYIVIPNWGSFQHYKDRTPLWIKNYTELMSDDAYLKLTLRQRGILHGIWLLMARGRLVLGSSPASLGSMLGDPTVRTRDLEALNHAGFIEFSTEKPLADRYQNASLEVEVDKETPLPPSRKRTGKPKAPAAAEPASGNHTCRTCGIYRPSATSLAEHEHWSHDGPVPQHLLAIEALDVPTHR